MFKNCTCILPLDTTWHTTTLSQVPRRRWGGTGRGAKAARGASRPKRKSTSNAVHVVREWDTTPTLERRAMATHMQHRLCATPRVHGIVRCSRRSRQYFRRYLPLLALSRERWGGVSYAGRARHGPRHTSCGGNGGTTSARMPTPRRTAASLHQQEAREKAAPVLLLLSCSPRQGGVGEEVTGRIHSHPWIRGASGRGTT